MKAEEGVENKVEEETFSEHVIIAGYGLGGRTLAKVLQEAEIPFIILELNVKRSNGL